MTFMAESPIKFFVRLGAVLVVAAGASACSSLPDWTDPTTWIGGDNDNQTASTADQTPENSQTPDIAGVPEKPETPSTPDEQKQVADSLSADRSKAQYSAEALRGGTEPAAAPPAAQAPQPAEAVASNETGEQGAGEEAAPPAAPPSAAPITSAPGTLPAVPSNPSAPASTATAEAAPEQAPAAPAITSAAPETEVASSAPAAVPAVPAVPAPMTADAALGFKPSGAPALDPTVAQFVPQPILARYRQTAMIGPEPAVPPQGLAGATEEAAATAAPRHRMRPKTDVGMGGPERMTGAVVANFEALETANATAPAVQSAAVGGGPQAVVFFPHDTTILDSEAKAQVRAAAKAFLSQGGQGFVRVVGHSSSRTANMPLSRHIVWNFERSQARANAVARALIREGVPAQKVLIEAVGDTQPVYYESMPQGEEGNRRAEIFFES